MKSIAVFNNKGGVGKTSLVYHLAWMYANLGCDVVVADLDPQANLTTMLLNDDELETLPMPRGAMKPVGWMARIPAAYREHVLGKKPISRVLSATDDKNCLATLKHFRSLMPLAQEAHKPMFALKPADGAIGGHTRAVGDCYEDFRALANEIAQRCDVSARFG